MELLRTTLNVILVAGIITTAYLLIILAAIPLLLADMASL